VQIPDPPGPLPFTPRRDRLYTQAELTERTPDGRTVDEAIGEWCHQSGQTLEVAWARAVHDASIDVALAHHLVGQAVVGVMGGHADARSDRTSRSRAWAADAGRLPRGDRRRPRSYGVRTRRMVRLFADADLGEAPSSSARHLRADRDEFVAVAGEVRRRWPDGGVSLGVPTWVYKQEPTSAF
jgi:hypothetical protein